MRIHCTINRISYYTPCHLQVSRFSRIFLAPPLNQHILLLLPFPYSAATLSVNIYYIPCAKLYRSFYFSDGSNVKWKRVGFVSGRSVRLDTIIWPGGDLSVAAVSSRARTVFRVVTALAPPFVMESELDEDGQCLRGN